MAVHSLVKKAALPLGTFVLAALIIRRLKPSFYVKWSEQMLQNQIYYDERSREVVVVAATVQSLAYCD